MDDIKYQFLALLNVMASDEVVEAMTDFTWKLYTKLKEKGFSPEEAMQIVVSMSKASK